CFGAAFEGAYMPYASLRFTNLSQANLRGAQLGRVKFQGALLEGNPLNDNETLESGSFKGAGLKAIDVSAVPQMNAFLEDIFGDATVILPSGARPGDDGWPDHWADTELDLGEFKKQWRDWQATLEPGWDADTSSTK
ncbi:MAG: pentapeptide repeat-containing protein, partial [Pseudomonadota bacterium]